MPLSSQATSECIDPLHLTSEQGEWVYQCIAAYFNARQESLTPFVLFPSRLFPFDINRDIAFTSTVQFYFSEKSVLRTTPTLADVRVAIFQAIDRESARQGNRYNFVQDVSGLLIPDCQRRTVFYKPGKSRVVKISLVEKSEEAFFLMRFMKQEAYLASVLGLSPKTPAQVEPAHSSFRHYSFFMQMRSIPGVDGFDWLRAFYQERKRVSLEQFIDFATQLVSAVKKLHDKGYVHHDLKFENIMVTDRGRVHLVDAATLMKVGDYESSLIGRKGTPEYFAPEYKKCSINKLDQFKATAALDIYALGRIFERFMFTAGTRSLLGKNTSSTVIDGLISPCAKPHELLLVELWRSMIDPDPTKRPTSAHILLQLQTLKVSFLDNRYNVPFQNISGVFCLGLACGDYFYLLQQKQGSSVLIKNSLSEFRVQIEDALKDIPEESWAIDAFLQGLDQSTLLGCESKQMILDKIDQVEEEFQAILNKSREAFEALPEANAVTSIAYQFSDDVGVSPQWRQRTIVTIDQMAEYCERFSKLLADMDCVNPLGVSYA